MAELKILIDGMRETIEKHLIWKNREICRWNPACALTAVRSLGSLPKAQTYRHIGWIWLHLWWIRGSPNHVCISSGPIMVLEQIANLSVVNSAYGFKSHPLRFAMSPVGWGGGLENLPTVKGSGVRIPIMALCWVAPNWFERSETPQREWQCRYLEQCM